MLTIALRVEVAALFEPSIEAAIASIRSQIQASSGQVKVSALVFCGKGVAQLNAICIRVYGWLVVLQRVHGFSANYKSASAPSESRSVDQTAKRKDPRFLSSRSMLITLAT